MAEPPPPAAAAAAAASKDAGDNDATTARKLQAVEQLTGIFGFERAVAEQAVDAIHSSTAAAAAAADKDGATATSIDVTACYNYILDAGLGSDRGGPVTPIEHCPHLAAHCCITTDQLPLQPGLATCTHTTSAAPTGGPKSDTTTAKDGVTTCAGTENWLCLECGAVRCSRYVNAHGLQHWQATQQQQPGGGDASSQPEGHCLAVSLSDLSVWCHLCQAYLVTHRNPQLQTIVQTLEELKFATAGDTTVPTVMELVAEPRAKRHKADSEMEDSDNDGIGKSGSSMDESKDEKDDDSEDNAGAAPKEDDKSSSEEEEGGDDEQEAEASDELMELLAQAAAAQGIPLEWLLRRAVQGDDDEEDEEPVEYPFDSPPKSLQDVANFIQSDNCRSIVVLAGAGMSVASGIPDFRSADGLYATLNPDLLTANEVEREAIRVDPSSSLDQHLFLQNPLPMLELQRDFILGTRAQRWKATLAHRFVELLHTKTGKLVRHYTQNIDGLEDQCTGLPREKVIAVHGSMDRAECARCKSEADFNAFCDSVRDQIKDLSGKDPKAPSESTAIECKVCGYAAMKPSIVLFRSSLPKAFFEKVPNDIKDADLLIVIGTSLRVAPANSLVWRAPKAAMRVLVNREEAGDHLGLLFEEPYATRDYFAQGECDTVLLKLMELLGWTDELEPLLLNNQLPESSAQLLRERLVEADRKISGEKSADVTESSVAV